MIGITLSSEQIRRAPPAVRQWIEAEIAATLGLKSEAIGSQPGGQLATCSQEEVAGVLSLIQGVFPAVNVLFELGRKGVGVAQDRVEAYRLADIQSHTRLESTGQVISCLELINEALQRVRGAADASFHALDADHCFIATQTQQSIHRLWSELLGGGQVPGTPAGDGRAVPQAVAPTAAPGLSSLASQILQPASQGNGAAG